MVAGRWWLGGWIGGWIVWRVCRKAGKRLPERPRCLHESPCCSAAPLPQVRDGVVHMLDAWLVATGAADKLFPAVAEALASPKCILDGKMAGLQWCVRAGARVGMHAHAWAGSRCLLKQQ